MMKYYFFHLILSCLYLAVLGNQELFAKFHQSEYKLKDFRVEMVRYNKDIYEHAEIKTFKFNRTCAAVNASIIPKVRVNGPKIEVLVQVFKFASNEYRNFPIRIQMNAFKAVKSNIGGLHKNVKCTNCPMDFIFEKGVFYYLCNGIIDETQLPPLMPVGRYRVDVTAFTETAELGKASGFAEVHIPFKFRE